MGKEYEAANGGALVNLDENQADIITKLGNKTSMIVSFQFVKAYRPLLSASRPVEAGHKVRFDKEDPHILLFSGGCNVEMGLLRSRSGYVIQVLLGRAEGLIVAASHKSTC